MEMNLYPDDWKFRDKIGCTYRPDEVMVMLANHEIDVCNDLLKVWAQHGYDMADVKLIHKAAINNTHMIIRKSVRPQDIIHAMSWIENLQTVIHGGDHGLKMSWLDTLAAKLEQWHHEPLKAILPLPRRTNGMRSVR